MNVFVDNNRIVVAGVTIAVQNQRIRIKLAEDFQIDVSFLYEADAPQIIRSEVRDGILYLMFNNFRTLTSNREPMRLGTYMGAPIFLNYVVNFIGDDEHHSIAFQYTFYTIKECDK